MYVYHTLAVIYKNALHVGETRANETRKRNNQKKKKKKKKEKKEKKEMKRTIPRTDRECTLNHAYQPVFHLYL